MRVLGIRALASLGNWTDHLYREFPGFDIEESNKVRACVRACVRVYIPVCRNPSRRLDSSDSLNSAGFIYQTLEHVHAAPN